MTRRNPSGLFGALIVTTVVQAAKLGWKLDWLTRSRGKAAVSFRFLDRHRFELSGVGETVPVRLAAETTDVAGMGLRCALLRRAQEVLSGAILHRSTCDLWLPDSVPPQTAYFGIHFRQPDLLGEPLDCREDAAGDRSPNNVYLEVHRRTLALGRHGTRSLFFVTTRQQANDRIESIAKQYGIFDRNDEASTDALMNLMFAIIGGGDIPPLTDWQENDDDEDDNPEGAEEDGEEE